ncbi:MAG: CehA/McbA family metallohydrolase [Sphaerochaetaceae bacterium]
MMRMKRNLLYVACMALTVLLLIGCELTPGDYPEPMIRTRPAEATQLLTYVEPEGERFILTGDLHCHSEESNGSGIPTSRVLSESIKVGYDFIALTDHDTLAQNQLDWSTSSLLVLSGMELGTDLGHFNIFGLTEPPNRQSTFATAAVLNTYIDYLHSLGALIQHNHPNRNLDVNVSFSYDLNTDFVEILNKSLNEEDKRTLQRDFHGMLAAGKKFVATAGSDAHKDYDNRHEFNNVWVSERSEVAVLYALKQGHSYITTAVDGPVISLTCDEAIMGDSVIFYGGQIVNIMITGLMEGSLVRVFDINGLCAETGTTGSSYQYDLDTESDMGFVRVEVWSPDGNSIIAFSNPLYITPST